MSNEERYQKYIKEHCKNCKHKKENLCNIKISQLNKTIETRCDEYERQN